MLVVDNNVDDVDSGEFFHSFRMITSSQSGSSTTCSDSFLPVIPVKLPSFNLTISIVSIARILLPTTTQRLPAENSVTFR